MFSKFVVSLNFGRIHFSRLYCFVFQPITDDDVDRIATCLRVLSEQTPLMSEIFNSGCRNALSLMLAAKLAEEKETQKVKKPPDMRHGGMQLGGPGKSRSGLFLVQNMDAP